MKRTWNRIGSLLLSVCMVLTLLPTMAFAETGEPLRINDEITAFAELDAEVSEQSVEAGTGQNELNLPDTLAATIEDSEGGEDETDIPVLDWESAPAYSSAYDAEGENTYVFTPVLDLPEGVSLADGVTPPTVTVTVTEEAALARDAGLLSAGAPVEITQEQTVSEIETAIETALGEAGVTSVTVTGSKTGAASTLYLTIGAGQTVVWQAVFEMEAADTVLIQLAGSGTFEVAAGGTVSATTGTAIFVPGGEDGRTAVTVSGGTVEATADNGKAISTYGSVEVSDGTVSAANWGTAIYAPGASSAVTVSGGTVEATGENGNAIETYGSVEVSDGTVSATTGYAIDAFGANSEVTVSGGVVEATGDSGRAILGGSVTVENGTVRATASNGYAIRAGSTVTVSGGTVEATGNFGTAIYLDGANAAVTVSGGRVTATTSEAIYAPDASAEKVTVSGGVVFAYGSTVSHVISGSGFTAPTGTGVVIAWNADEGATSYSIGSDADLTVLPDGKAWWDTEDETGGIAYENGDNAGFIPIAGVTVTLDTGVNITGKTIDAIQTAIQTVLNGEGVTAVTVIGSKTGVTEPLELDIPTGKTVVWQAAFTAAESFAGNLIQFGGEGTFEVAEDGTVTAGTDINGTAAIRAINSASTVKVSGGTVATTDGIGYAIHANGSVTVEDGTVRATTGTAIYASDASSAVTVGGGTVEATGTNGIAIEAKGSVEVSGGTVEATGNYGIAIYANGEDSVVTVEDGTVSATTGYAIYATGASSAVTVEDGTVEATGEAGCAIYAFGEDSVVTVNDGTVEATGAAGVAIYAHDADAVVTVSGGRVEASGADGIAIYANGEDSVVTVEDGTVEATGDNGTAIRATGENAAVTVDGGTVSATTGYAIYAFGESSAVIVSGTGKVHATASGGYAISTNGSVTVTENAEVSATTGYAIRTYNGADVTVGGGRVTATTGYAIYTSNEGSTVTVSGGVVFAYGSTIIGYGNVIYMDAGSATINVPGVVLAWNAGAGESEYPLRTATHIAKSPASAEAYWYNDSAGVGGIAYKNGDNEGFIPITGVTVARITLTAGDLSYTAIPTDHTYTGSAQGIGDVTLNAPHDTAFNETTGGTLTVEYGGSATVPTDAGTYAVTAEISGGTEYAPTSISLGDYTIAQKSITITPTAGQSKIYGVADPALTYMPSPALLGDDAFTGALGRAIGATVGNYAITLGTLSAGGNYTLALAAGTVNFEITQATVTGIAAVDNVEMTAYEARTADTAAEVVALATLPATVSVTTTGGTATLPVTWGDITGGYNANGAVYTVTGTLTGNGNIATSGVTASITVTVSPVTAVNPTFSETFVRMGSYGGTAAASALAGDGILPTGGSITAAGESIAYTVSWSGDDLDTSDVGNSELFTGTVSYTDPPDWLTIPGSSSVSRTVTVSDTTPVANATQLKAALESTTPDSITVTGNITVTEIINLGASHTLVIPDGLTLSFTGTDARIRFGSYTLDISGGGSLALGNTSIESLIGLSGTLNLADIDVTVTGYGINVGTLNINDGATVTAGEGATKMIGIEANKVCTVNAGGEVDIQGFGNTGIYVNGGTLHIDGGTVTVGPGTVGNSGIEIRNSGTYTPGTLRYTAGTLDGTAGGRISFEPGAQAEGLSGTFSDRNSVLTASGSVTVGASTALPSADGLTAGSYAWADGVFAKHGIILSAQPQGVTVTKGAISGALWVTAETSNGETISYQWYKINHSDLSFAPVEGAVSSTFDIPTNLTVGSHYYVCWLIAAGYDNVWSDEATVTVNAAGGGSSSGGSSGGSSSGGSVPSASFSRTTNGTGIGIDVTGLNLPDGVTLISPHVYGLPVSSTGRTWTLLLGKAPASVGRGGTLGGRSYLALYEFKLLDENGKPVHNIGRVSIRIPVPQGANPDSLAVLYYDESDETFVRMSAVVEGGYLVFSTTHFSYYMVTGVAAGKPAIPETGGNDPQGAAPQPAQRPIPETAGIIPFTLAEPHKPLRKKTAE